MCFTLFVTVEDMTMVPTEGIDMNELGTACKLIRRRQRLGEQTSMLAIPARIDIFNIILAFLHCGKFCISFDKQTLQDTLRLGLYLECDDVIDEIIEFHLNASNIVDVSLLMVKYLGINNDRTGCAFTYMSSICGLPEHNLKELVMGKNCYIIHKLKRSFRAHHRKLEYSMSQAGQ